MQTISDWKKKKTNPVSDKIFIICEVLGVTPYDLLSGAEHIGVRSRENVTYVIDKGTELGMLIESYQNLDGNCQRKLLGYMEALKDMNNEKENNFLHQNTYIRKYTLERMLI